VRYKYLLTFVNNQSLTDNHNTMATFSKSKEWNLADCQIANVVSETLNEVTKSLGKVPTKTLLLQELWNSHLIERADGSLHIPKRRFKEAVDNILT